MTDLLSEPIPLGLRGVLHSMIGCDWGRTIGSETDPEPCMAQAVQRVALHDPPGSGQYEVYKLCPEHLASVLSETTTSTGPQEEKG